MNLATAYMGIELETRWSRRPRRCPRPSTGSAAWRRAASARSSCSLFEEELRREAELFSVLGSAGSESFAEALTYMPEPDEGADSGRRYLSLIERAREAVGIPLIGSLNGVTPAGWTRYARAIEEAGASAIELNVYDVPATRR